MRRSSAERLHRGDDHQRAAGDRIGTVGGEPGHRPQGRSIPGGEPRGELADLPALEDVPVDPGDRVSNRSHVDLGEVSHRAPGAHHAAVLGKDRDSCVTEGLGHVVAECGDLGRPRRVAAQELIGHHECAQLERPPAERAPALEVGQLEAAAADVDQVAGVDRQTVDGSEKRVARLLLAVDDLDRQSRVGLEPGEHAVAVGRGADRGGGDGDGPLRAGGCCDRPEVAHRRDGLGDRARLEAAASVDVARQLERGSRVGDDVELTGIVEPQHRDSGGVRPDVDDGERRFQGDPLPGPNSIGSGKYRQGQLPGRQRRPVTATSGAAGSRCSWTRSRR